MKTEAKMPVVRLADIAKVAEVSRTTVAHVLMRSGGKNVKVSDDTARRIKQVAGVLGYRPNIVARQLAGKKSNIISVLLDSYAPQVYHVILAQMERHAAKRGYRFMVGQSHGEVDRIEAHIQDSVARGIDGLIWIPYGKPEPDQKIVQMLRAIKSVAAVNTPACNCSKLCYAVGDPICGFRKAVHHLINDSGRNRIAILALSTGTKSILGRMEGYRQALADNNIDFDPGLVCKIGGPLQITVESLYSQVEQLMREYRPDAIVANDDITAAKVFCCLNRMGYNVPKDVALTGYDNLPFAELYNPALTTLDLQPSKIAESAVDMMISLIKGDECMDEQKHVVVEPELVIRESS